MNAKARAMANPDEILAIVIDGSDQSSYATPYFSQVTKEGCKGWRMRLKLIGALVTGRLLQFFTLASNWESGKCMVSKLLAGFYCMPKTGSLCVCRCGSGRVLRRR